MVSINNGYDSRIAANSVCRDIYDTIVEKLRTPVPVEFYQNKKYGRYRIAKIIMICISLESDDEFALFDEAKKYNIVKKLEKQCYNEAIYISRIKNISPSWTEDKFCNIYDSISLKIASNLDASNGVRNISLIKKVIHGEINLDLVNLAKLDHQELFREKNKEIFETFYQSKHIKLTVKTNKMYKCETCGQSECIVETRRNRSPDEAENFTIKCVNCNAVWNHN